MCIVEKLITISEKCDRYSVNAPVSLFVMSENEIMLFRAGANSMVFKTIDEVNEYLDEWMKDNIS